MKKIHIDLLLQLQIYCCPAEEAETRREKEEAQNRAQVLTVTENKPDLRHTHTGLHHHGQNSNNPDYYSQIRVFPPLLCYFPADGQNQRADPDKQFDFVFK